MNQRGRRKNDGNSRLFGSIGVCFDVTVTDSSDVELEELVEDFPIGRLVVVVCGRTTRCVMLGV